MEVAETMVAMRVAIPERSRTGRGRAEPEPEPKSGSRGSISLNGVVCASMVDVVHERRCSRV